VHEVGMAAGVHVLARHEVVHVGIAPAPDDVVDASSVVIEAIGYGILNDRRRAASGRASLTRACPPWSGASSESASSCSCRTSRVDRGGLQLFMFATCGPWLHTTRHRCPVGTLHKRASHGSISRWDARVALPSGTAVRWEEYRTSPLFLGGRLSTT
jgi:hypothetical protein